ncbi:glycosyltransferase [Lactobacillus amylovorus]|uniref:glycosyltransferase n=1 Tax=Lactobacillus amylovorus TaxID=1604 RepID=UPI0021A69F13|nr:glycosyltransferase [Lactobacillus amylovorus]MCT3586102.1 glycosyltransferase [Lactobacillus amylovorus]
MKKAIIAVPYLTGKGGTETVIKNFYDAVVKYSKDSVWNWKLISFGGTKYPYWMKEWQKKVYRFSNKRLVQLGCYALIMPFLIKSVLKKYKPDVFIATNPVIWSLAYKYKKQISPNTKIIAWYHYSFKMKNVKTKYLNTADKFWAISSGIRKELISMGVPSKKIDLIYNPVSIINIKKVPRSYKQNHFIYIGRIDYDGQKNVSELIKALNRLKGEWHCDLYGNVNSETKKRLLNIASENTRNNISFKGFYSDIWNRIKEADVLILTSKYEGFGMVLCEAAARGISLVSSDCPMGPQDIINEKNGFLYESQNILQLSGILSNILSFKNKLAKPNAVKKSVEKFDYVNFYNRVQNSLNNEGF